MTFQKIAIALFVLLVAGLGVAFYSIGGLPFRFAP
jgi:hypothetical protein